MRSLPTEKAAAELGDHERRNRLMTPVVRAVLLRLAGLRYVGPEPDRRRLVEKLPLVALRPEGRTPLDRTPTPFARA